MAIRLKRNFSMPSSDDEARCRLLKATPEFLGGFGEAIWANVLASSGWLYVSLTAIEQGGAPMGRSKGR